MDLEIPADNVRQEAQRWKSTEMDFHSTCMLESPQELYKYRCPGLSNRHSKLPWLRPRHQHLKLSKWFSQTARDGNHWSIATRGGLQRLLRGPKDRWPKCKTERPRTSREPIVCSPMKAGSRKEATSYCPSLHGLYSTPSPPPQHAGY